MAAALQAERLASSLHCAAVSPSGTLLAVSAAGGHNIRLYERSPGGGAWQEVR